MADTTNKFWDKAADKYFKSKIADMDGYEEGLQRTRAVLRPDMDVLEIGCGTGMTAIKLADAVGQITATDISPKMIELARGRMPPQNVTFKVLNLEGSWARENASDAVLAYNILHLVPDLESVLSEIFRQLKPGGLFVSKTACLKGVGWYLGPMIKAMQMIGKAPHVLLFTVAELETMIEAAGFEITEVDQNIKGMPRRLIFARKPGG